MQYYCAYVSLRRTSTGASVSTKMSSVHIICLKDSHSNTHTHTHTHLYTAVDKDFRVKTTCIKLNCCYEYHSKMISLFIENIAMSLYQIRLQEVSNCQRKTVCRYHVSLMKKIIQAWAWFCNNKLSHMLYRTCSNMVKRHFHEVLSGNHCLPWFNCCPEQSFQQSCQGNRVVKTW